MTAKMKLGYTNGENSHKASCKTSNAIYLTSIIVIVLASSFLIQLMSVSPAEDLTRYYNFNARVANKNATLSIANVDACYNLIFKGALDYYCIKQLSYVENDTSSVDVSESLKGQSDNSSANTPPEKVRASSELYDVFR